MSDLQRTLSEYIEGFKKALDDCQTRDDCVILWQSQRAARYELCIVQTSYVYNRLHEMWTERGRELAAKEAA